MPHNLGQVQYKTTMTPFRKEWIFNAVLSRLSRRICSIRQEQQPRNLMFPFLRRLLSACIGVTVLLVERRWTQESCRAASGVVTRRIFPHYCAHDYITDYHIELDSTVFLAVAAILQEISSFPPVAYIPPSRVQVRYCNHFRRRFRVCARKLDRFLDEIWQMDGRSENRDPVES